MQPRADLAGRARRRDGLRIKVVGPLAHGVEDVRAEEVEQGVGPAVEDAKVAVVRALVVLRVRGRVEDDARLLQPHDGRRHVLAPRDGLPR